MSTYILKSRAIEAKRIISVNPLTIRGQMVGPNEGLLLALENGGTQRWVGYNGERMPIAGDYSVTDSELDSIYVVAADKFILLFDETEHGGQ